MKFLLIKFRLMFAANTGFKSACALLIENGANVSSIDKNSK